MHLIASSGTDIESLSTDRDGVGTFPITLRNITNLHWVIQKKSEGGNVLNGESQGADHIDQEGAPRGGSKIIVKADAEERTGVTFNEVPGENCRRDAQNEANNEERAYTNETGNQERGGSGGTKMQRGSFLSAPETSAEQGKSSSISSQQPNGEAQVSTPRKRGRPGKNKVAPVGTQASEPSSSMDKGALGTRKEGSVGDGLRRSSRDAAKSAIQQITEQSKKRPKAAATSSTPSTPSQKAIASPKGRATRSSTQTPSKRPHTDEYEVEFILDTRKKNGTTEYLVKWKGYHARENTWEPAKNLTHCAQALNEFRAGGSEK
ncbi:putative reverse transcriptase domain protein [Rosellinia necatrix]|uniref:Putative reverse transcriptase domain protein n=1 Tax=Rosellinia necatrix TaxID=77044 RepID=A0A1W2TIW8_ROSNE|nr:putative reverse transcriptase domain protein [Rosellinia necatrix]